MSLLTQPTRKPARTSIFRFVLGVLGLTILIALALGSRSASFLGRLLCWARQGLGGARLVPSMLILTISLAAVWVVLRELLEDLGFRKSEDTWQDWRTEPLPPPEQQDAPSRGSRPPTDRRLSHRELWHHRGTFRHLRYRTPRKHWGYNNSHEVR